MREQKAKAQVKKTNYEITPTLSPPHPHSNMKQAPPPPPNLCHPPIIHNNNRMDTEFLVQMRQSNKRQCKE